jgi:hypothetical protein
MSILKRLAVWLLERFVEALFLGLLFGYLMRLPLFSSLLRDFWRLALIVAVILFMHGYYVTTALFGVVWRSRKSWLYPAIAAALLVLHTRLIFWRAGSDFTRETRAMELPFAVMGACIVFACSFAGGRVLDKWLTKDAIANTYLAATGITLLVFTLANTAHWMRCCLTDSFRPIGLPFTFYRDGGFVGKYVWQGGRFTWSGVAADAALIAAIVVLLGTAWKKVNSHRARASAHD